MSGGSCSQGAGCLTSRQAVVISQAAAGLSSQQIASVLRISVRTVYAHMLTARNRAGAASTTELVARCYESGILEPGQWPPKVTRVRCLGIYDQDAGGWRCPCMLVPKGINSGTNIFIPNDPFLPRDVMPPTSAVAPSGLPPAG